jgi:hypothetical protein
VRLTQKLADTLDGIDVSRVRVGDWIDLTETEGKTLIAEGWAEAETTSPVINSPQNSAQSTKHQ